MKSDYTHISVVLDRSGSMSSIKNDAEGGLKEFLESHRKAKGTTTLTLVKFDAVYEVEYDMTPLNDVGHVTLEPRGSTALLDAIGRTITITGEKLRALPEDQRPQYVFVVIITDGQENSSVEFEKPAIKEMVERQTNQFKWHFVFLGANMDAIDEGAQLGILRGGTMTYGATGQSVNSAYRVTTAATQRVRSGTSATMDFMDIEREETLSTDDSTGKK